MFLGGFVHAPNVDAVHWFVARGPRRWSATQDVRRPVRRRRATASPTSVAALARDDVVVVGHVPDLADLFATHG